MDPESATTETETTTAIRCFEDHVAYLANVLREHEVPAVVEVELRTLAQHVRPTMPLSQWWTTAQPDLEPIEQLMIRHVGTPHEFQMK